ncbi:HTH HARE-type domain-containing protein [Tumidithrix helvetica PCC 7403]|uniref:hypothetical protein n=1 Tax=Tumidithrix helvetica TaxID=3457545 RepID=UPI003C9E60D8
MGLDLPTASLVAYQKQLQDFLEANEEKVSQARAQLQNVEALLASLPATVAKAGKKVAAKVTAAVVELAPPPAPVKVSKKEAKAAAAPAAKKAEPKVVTKPAGKPGRRSSSITLRSAYQGCTLTEAIEKVLQERKGQYVNADGVVDALYGDLTEEVLKVAKERVTKNLSKGKIEGKWERVPEQLGYYTLSLKDASASAAKSTAKTAKTAAKATAKTAAKVVAKVAKKVEAEPKAAKKAAKAPAKAAPAPTAKKAAKAPAKAESGRSGSIKLRSSYQGSTLTEAIEKVLQERKGEYVNADSVVKALYGELTPDVFRVAKERVTKNLSKGKIEGKWERVPEQLGYYTLSLAAIKA